MADWSANEPKAKSLSERIAAGERSLKGTKTVSVGEMMRRSDMLDPEALIVKGGILALAMLSEFRLVLQDFNNLVNDFRRK
jgi:hypothetical protein